jgi:hypothetical protein
MKFRERGEQQVAPRELFRFDSCMSLVQGLAMVDTICAHPFYAKGLLLALRAGEPGRIAKALCAEAGYYATAGARYRDKSERLLRTAEVLGRKSGNHQSIGMVSSAQGMIAFLRGDWKLAVNRMQRAEVVLRQSCTGVAWEIATSHMMESVSLYLMGQLAELGRRMPRILKDAEARGDLFESTDLRTRLSHALALADDDAPRARRELDAALKEWGRDAFDLQHWWALIGRIEIDLYAGRCREAWEQAVSEWTRLRRSFLMRVQYVHIESLHHRACAALALATDLPADSTERRSLLRLAEKDTRKILRHGVPWGNALAELQQAGAAEVRGNRSEALQRLRSGYLMCHAADMELYAAAARRAEGQLAGGKNGRELVEWADRWMAQQAIRNPERMTAMLVPGVLPHPPCAAGS